MYPHLPAQKNVKTTFEFVDAEGIALSTPLISASYSVTDEDDVEVDSGTLSAEERSGEQHVVTTDATFNQLSINTVRGLRSIILSVIDADNVEVEIIKRYYIESSQTIKAGLNSIVSFSKVLILVPDIPLLEGWEGALSDKDRKAALVEAYERLGRFKLNDKFEENTIATYDEITLLELDSRMIQDFAKAQIIEANALLGGEPHHDKRLQGVMSESAGESTTFYRSGTALSRGISAKAYAYVAKYLNNIVVASRA
jgi:hypothetical protein